MGIKVSLVISNTLLCVGTYTNWISILIQHNVILTWTTSLHLMTIKVVCVILIQRITTYPTIHWNGAIIRGEDFGKGMWLTMCFLKLHNIVIPLIICRVSQIWTYMLYGFTGHTHEYLKTGGVWNVGFVQSVGSTPHPWHGVNDHSWECCAIST